jgi:hypothetical protein
MSMDDVAGLRVNPILNKFLERLLEGELALIRVGVILPVGGSRLLVARKPMMIKKGV